MNLGTTCVFEHQEMCCPYILYLVHFPENLTLEQARTKMGEITGYDFTEGAYFSVGLDYVDNTRLYHLAQLNVESEELTEYTRILKRFRPQILERTLKGEQSDYFFMKCIDADAASYMWQIRNYEQVKETLARCHAEALERSKGLRAQKRAEQSARRALESQSKLSKPE